MTLLKELRELVMSAWKVPSVSLRQYRQWLLRQWLLRQWLLPRVVPAFESNFNKSCATCHNAGIAGAPKFADAAAWAPRVEKGMDVLYAQYNQWAATSDAAERYVL